MHITTYAEDGASKVLPEQVVAIPRQAFDPIIQNAALSARSRRKLNNIPRIYRWMEDTEHNSLTLSGHLRRLYRIGQDDIKEESALVVHVTHLDVDENHLHGGGSQEANMKRHAPPLERASSISSSDSGSSYSLPDLDSDLTPRSEGERARPNLTIAVKPSPYAARYAVKHVFSPEPTPKQTTPRQLASPYAPATVRNGWPYYEPRAPAAAYMPTSPRSSVSSGAEDLFHAAQQALHPEPLRRQNGSTTTGQRRPATSFQDRPLPPIPRDQYNYHQHSKSADAVPITPVYERPALVHISRKSINAVPQLHLTLDHTSFLIPELPRLPGDQLYTLRWGDHSPTHSRARSVGAMQPHLSLPKVYAA